MPQDVNRYQPRNLRFLLKILFSGLIFILLNINASAAIYDWLGATSNDVTVASNWSNETTHAGGVPGSGDDVYVGVNSTYQYYLLVVLLTANINLTASNMPIVTASTTWKSLTFGYNGPTSSYVDGSNSSGPTYGIMYNLSLSVNTGVTLTVTGNVTQNHNPSVRATPNNYLTTTIGGAGTLLCQGNFLVGDVATEPSNTVADVSKVALQITQLTITGNVILNSNGNNASGGNAGICYPLFSVEKGTTTLLGQITFATNNSPLLSGYNTYNPGQPGYLGQTAYQGYGEVEADNTSGSVNTFELQNKQPVVKADNFYIFFEGGGSSGTILYDDPNAETQTVYTANEPSATTTATYINIVSPSYYNLTFSGPSPKSVDGNSTLGTVTQGLVVGNNWTTSGGVVNLGINNPTVTIGNGWTNSTTVTQGTGSITTGGFVTNSSIITGSTATITVGGLFTNTGTFTCGTGNVTYKGGYTNSATFTASTTGIIYFTGTQTLLDNSTAGTKFYNVTFNSPSSTTTTATMTAGVGNFTVADVGILTMASPAQLVAGSTAVGGAAYLTLNSDATGSASIAQMPSTCSISGNVNVQRYITGGSGYRGYRFLSSPVNITDALPQTSQHNIDLHYLTGGMLTGGPGGVAGGFTMATTNPLIYLFDETRLINHLAYTGGENVGVNSIYGNTPAYSVVTIQSNAARTLNSPILVPVGNAYLVYFVGIPSDGLNNPLPPSNATVTATGYLNQGTIPVYVTNAGSVPSSTTMSYTPITTTNAATPGLHQIGNPYASTIDLNQFWLDNSTNITSTIAELKEPNQAYIGYNAQSGAASVAGSGAGRYIVSGQGFYLNASGTGKTVTFYEDEKVSKQLTSSTNPPLLLSQKSKTESTITAAEMLPTGLEGLHLQLNQDSAIYTQTGIYFSKAWSDKYEPNEDAIDMDGSSVYLSSYSSDNKRLSINEMYDYSTTSRKVVKLYVSAASYGAFKLSMADIKNIDTLYNVYLRDHLLNDSVNLRTAKASYNFNITADTASYGSNRFDLVLEREALPPYQLLTFTGQKMTSSIQLNWVANGAGTYTGFVLEKEGADNTFSAIYTTQSNNSSRYSFVDNNPVIGNNIYRLAQNDINGNIIYSSLITIGYNNVTSNGYFSVYPNPSKSIINVLVNSTAASTANYTADIYNTSGTLMDHRVLNTYTWTEDVSSYKEGIYIIALKNTNGDGLEMEKFIKVK